MLWIVAAAFAAPPDRDAAVLGAATDVVDQLSVAPDGALVAGVTAGQAFIASTDAWSAWKSAPCTVTAVAAGVGEVWAGCADGSVVRIPVEDAGPGAPDAAIAVMADAKVLALYRVGDTVWALTTPTTGTVVTVKMTPVDVAAGTAAAATALPYPGYFESVLVGEILYVLHGAAKITRVPLGGGTPTVSLQNLMLTPADACPSPNQSVYVVDASGSLFEFNAQSLTWLLRTNGLGSPVACGAAGSWVAVVAGTTASVWAVADQLDPTAPDDTFPVATGVLDVVADELGYAYAGGAGLSVWTSNPWVVASPAAPSSATDGDAVTITFSVDRDADWSVHLGGDRTGTGAVLASGRSAAGDVTTTLTVDDTFAEGDNRLYVLAEADGAIGHDRTSVTVDNPPGTPALTAANLSWSDAALILEFDGIPDADLAKYDVYVTTTPFEPADWPTGGPAFDGVDAITTPIAVTAAGGAAVTYRIAPLTNETTYYVAVRAIDQGGLMGPMSDVISNSPRRTFSAAELAGDAGGPACATAPLASFGAVAIGAIAALARRRRLAAAILGVVLVAPGAATAQDSAAEIRAEQAARPRRDLTLAHGDFELRYGGARLVDPNITGVYGDSGNQFLQLEFGVQPFNALASSDRTRQIAEGQSFDRVPDVYGFFEIDAGVGFFQELAFLVAADATGTSGDKTMLTLWPLSLDATIRAQLVDEQLIVPFVRAGGDYVLWDERWDNASGGKDKVSGAKTGYHYGAGVAFLLDPLAPARASLLEAQSGVNDTYVVVEWRRQFIKKPVGTDEGGLDFSGKMVTMGLKLDF